MARFLRQRLAIVTVNARFLDTPRTQRREMGPLPYFPTSSMTGLAMPNVGWVVYAPTLASDYPVGKASMRIVLWAGRGGKDGPSWCRCSCCTCFLRLLR